jgi:hypothetical protein
MKKVAFHPYFSKEFITALVLVGHGPSSNVNEITFSLVTIPFIRRLDLQSPVEAPVREASCAKVG